MRHDLCGVEPRCRWQSLTFAFRQSPDIPCPTSLLALKNDFIRQGRQGRPKNAHNEEEREKKKQQHNYRWASGDQTAARKYQKAGDSNTMPDKNVNAKERPTSKRNRILAMCSSLQGYHRHPLPHPHRACRQQDTSIFQPLRLISSFSDQLGFATRKLLLAVRAQLPPANGPLPAGEGRAQV